MDINLRQYGTVLHMRPVRYTQQINFSLCILRQRKIYIEKKTAMVPFTSKY